MTATQKLQIQTLLSLLTRRHLMVCESLAIAARGSLPNADRQALLAIVPMDAVGTVNPDAVAELAQLVSAVDAIEVE